MGSQRPMELESHSKREVAACFSMAATASATRACCGDNASTAQPKAGPAQPPSLLIEMNQTLNAPPASATMPQAQAPTQGVTDQQLRSILMSQACALEYRAQRPAGNRSGNTAEERTRVTLQTSSLLQQMISSSTFQPPQRRPDPPAFGTFFGIFDFATANAAIPPPAAATTSLLGAMRVRDNPDQVIVHIDGGSGSVRTEHTAARGSGSRDTAPIQPSGSVHTELGQDGAIPPVPVVYDGDIGHVPSASKHLGQAIE